MDDYETNKRKHGLVALIGLVWCAIWIIIISTEVGYMNQNYIAPAGKVPVSENTTTDIINANCVSLGDHSSICGGCYPLSCKPTYTNVSEHFGALLRYGLSVFLIKAIFFAIHFVKPQRKIALVTGGVGALLFLIWVIVLSSWRFSKAGVCCSWLDKTLLPPPLDHFHKTGQQILRILSTIYAFMIIGGLFVLYLIRFKRN